MVKTWFLTAFWKSTLNSTAKHCKEKPVHFSLSLLVRNSIFWEKYSISRVLPLKGGRGFGAKKGGPEVGSKKLKSFGRRMPSLIVTELYFQNSQEIFIFLHEIEENFACFPFFLEPWERTFFSLSLLKSWEHIFIFLFSLTNVSWCRGYGRYTRVRKWQPGIKCRPKHKVLPNHTILINKGPQRNV